MGLFRLELKKQPWLLHLAGLIALTLLFCVPLGHQLGVLTTTDVYHNGVRVADYVDRTADDDQAELVAAQRGYVKQLRTFRQTGSATAQALIQDVKAPLSRRDYLQVNRLLLDALERHPELLADFALRPLFGWSEDKREMTDWEVKTKRLRYAIAHRINRPFTSNAGADSTVAVLRVFAHYTKYIWKWEYADGQRHYWYKLHAGTPLAWIFLFYAALVLAGTFNFDRRKHTENLMRVTPRGDLGMILTRAAVTVGLIGFVALGFTLLGNAANAVLPGHVWGSWFYPQVVVAHSTATVYPVWQYIASELWLLMLWVFVLSGFTFIFSQLVHSLVLLLALDAATFLAVPLHLMELLPMPLQRLTPALFAQDEQFRGIVNLSAVWAVFIFWGLATWGFGAWLLRARTRGYWWRGKAAMK